MECIKKFFKHFFSDSFRARYRAPYIMFFKNTKVKHFSSVAEHSEIYGPLLADPRFLHIDDYVRIQPFNRIISSSGRVIIKKFSAIGLGCTFIPGTHIPTVGLPQFMSRAHINDVSKDIVIEEDVWVGANSTFLSKAHVGRGAVVGANSLVTSKISPYSVVAGSPARIMATRFTLEEIILHEETLYPVEERLSREFLENLFETEYKGLRSIGTSEISKEDKERLSVLKKDINVIDYAECK